MTTSAAAAAFTAAARLSEVSESQAGVSHPATAVTEVLKPAARIALSIGGECCPLLYPPSKALAHGPMTATLTPGMSGNVASFFRRTMAESAAVFAMLTCAALPTSVALREFHAAFIASSPDPPVLASMFPPPRLQLLSTPAAASDSSPSGST
eukprot:4779517-Prymnesium_polylepis.1